MKKQLLFKNSLIAVICCLIFSSCSQSRYGSLSKVKVETKIAKVDKKKNVIDVQVNNNSIGLNTETPKVVLNSETTKNEEIQTFETKMNVFSPKLNFTPKRNKATRVENRIVDSKKYASKESINIPKKLDEVKSSSTDFKLKKLMFDNTTLVIIAFFIPFVAVGLVSNWTDTSSLLLCILLTILCWLPGFIYAIDYIGKNNR